MNEKFLSLVIFSFVIIATFSCKKDSVTDEVEPVATTLTKADSVNYNPDWSFVTHGTAAHDYTVVMPQDKVNTIRITMTATQWTAIRTNMKSLYGADFGGGSAPAGNFASGETDYVDVTLEFGGKVWKNVGFRLKGNSSLTQAWGQGNYKLPFRFNFDKFEDTYPAIKNQHFYGFKELTFSPGYSDQSLVREKLATDVFRMAGVAAAHTAFYAVYIDFGSGSEYCGVYTAVEVPEDNMVNMQFGDDTGNIYKPESQFSSFVESQFEKKNNEDIADFTDVKAFVSALNSSLRNTNVSLWRTNLEATFDMDYFLKYLAVNNTIVNWDTYGNMAHNYYLYNSPTQKLMWIPWDHNEAFATTPGITGSTNTGGPGGVSRTGVSLSMNEVATSWPLLNYVANDPVYMAKYKTYLKSFNTSVYTNEAIGALCDKYQALISPYAIGANGEQAKHTYITSSASFTSAFSTLKSHVASRKILVSSYVP